VILVTKTIIIVFREYHQYFTCLYNRYPVYILEISNCAIIGLLNLGVSIHSDRNLSFVHCHMRGHNYNIVLEIKVAPFTVIRAFCFHNGTMLRFEYVATYKDIFPYISDRKQNFSRFPQCQSQEI